MKLITSIHKLPLNVFVDCLEGDYSGLVIEGDPSEEEKEIVFAGILEQYNDAMSDDNQKRYISAYKEYQRAKVRHDLVITYIEMLNNYYVAKWADDLNRLVESRFDFKAALDKSIDDYRALLKKCNNRNKSNLMKYRLAEMNLEEIAKTHTEKGVKQDRAYFIKIMRNLKRMENREIPFDISTYEFCLLVNDYGQYVEQMKK